MSAPLRVLVAEDEEHLGTILETFLGARGHVVLRVRDGREALDALRRERWDVALLDVMMPEMDGLEVLRALEGEARAPQAVVMTGNATVDVALSALQLGAYDYITKPYRMAEVDTLVRRAAEKGALRREVALLRRRLASLDAPPVVVTRHPPLLGALADGSAARRACVVIATGEPGAGRRTLLRALHAADAPARAPLLEERSSGLPEHDAATLFGRSAAEPGALETASGGALLLHDAERLDAGVAGQLATALAEGALVRGDGTRVAGDARVLLAAAGPLAAPLPGACELQVPPLRERVVDIRPLAEHLLRAAPYGAARALDDEAARWLEAQPWPGNVAELRLVVELAALRAAGGVLRLADVRGAGTATDQHRERR